MIVNYCISRAIRAHGKKKRTETRNHALEVFGLRWDSDDFHRNVRARIVSKHPGYSIVGYCKAPDMPHPPHRAG